MNKLKIKLTILFAALGLWVLPTTSLVLVGCAPGCSTVAEGHDPIVVRAEQVADLSFEVLDAFVTLEENNRAYLRTVSPEIEKAANTIRRDGRAALEGLRDATRTYKTNRTPENKANLDTWIATVEKLRQIALKHLATAKPPQ